MSYLSSQPQEQKLPLSLTGRYLRQNAVRLTIIAIWVILVAAAGR